jgi:hypothetical protein
MDPRRFDRLTQTLSTTGSRRATLAGLLAAAGGVLSLGASLPAVAQGCQPNGTRCRDGAQCCSGRCKRRNRDTHGTCRQADNQGECTVALNICTSNSITCGSDGGGSLPCLCYVTKTGRSFCGARFPAEATCGCTSNTQCEKQAGKGAKCVQGTAFCDCATNFCVGACSNLDPVP